MIINLALPCLCAAYLVYAGWQQQQRKCSQRPTKRTRRAATRRAETACYAITARQQQTARQLARFNIVFPIRAQQVEVTVFDALIDVEREAA